MRFDIYEPTMLQSFTLCPEKFHLRYVEGIESEGNLAMFRGLIGHQVLGNPKETLDDIFHAAVANYRTGILRPRFDLPFEDEWKLHDELTESINGWYRFVAQRDIKIIEREKRIEFECAGRKFLGTIDLIYSSPLNPPGTVCIGDFKFGRRQSDRQMDRNLQHALYWYGATKLGLPVHHNTWISMNDLIPYKTNGPKAKKGQLKGQVLYPIEISEVDVPWIEEQVARICSYIEAGVRYQASYGTEAPCVICEYANHACSRFKAGRGAQYRQDMVAMSQAVKEAALVKAIEDE